MARLCERPGCSRPAEVIYGMSAERLTVWLEPFDAALASRVGVLCRRHADAMVVPNRWTLDDRRPAASAVELTLLPEQPAEPEQPAGSANATDTDTAVEPQLFTSHTSVVPEKAAKKRKRRQTPTDDTGQLELLPPPQEPAHQPPPEQPAAVDADPDPDEPSVAEPVAPWRPVFDQDSDLEGLLDVRSPLLSRAFRGGSPKP